jgi:hypothetical protein
LFSSIIKTNDFVDRDTLNFLEQLLKRKGHENKYRQGREAAKYNRSVWIDIF